MIGISSYCHPYFCEENSKNLGFNIDELNTGLIIKKYDIPILLIHDKNDKEFENSNKFNILKIPFQNHIDIINERISKNTTSFKFTRIPNLPKELIVYEFLPNPEIPRRKETIICVHGWDGRGLNFYKFIPKLQEKGFRVLAPDFPIDIEKQKILKVDVMFSAIV